VEKYILFIIDECFFCSEAILLLESLNKQYKTVDVTQDLNVRAQLKIAFNWGTFPVVLAQEDRALNLIGGYTDLKEQMVRDESE
jgi:glutaredoxin-related protein